MKTLCLDFDGVMNTYDGWKGEDVLFEPREGLREFLLAVRQAGFEVVVNSTRVAERIDRWLDQYGLTGLVQRVTDRKPPAVVYLDDRAVTFRGDFQQSLQDILAFRVFWEKEPR